MAGDIAYCKFCEVDLGDAFFDSLRESYNGFDDWFRRKGDEYAYVLNDEQGVQAFLYLKEELGVVKDVVPPLNTKRCLKVGTFKINAHGTKLGERFVKKKNDHAIVTGKECIYVTVISEHRSLIRILERYGFLEYGKKVTISGVELVFVKDFTKMTGDALSDYPVVNAIDRNVWLMSIYPQWHTKLFPDSILHTEDASIVEDISHTNSIHKAYIGWMDGMRRVNSGDVVVIYRAVGNSGRPWFESVISSLCVVSDNVRIGSYKSFDDFKNEAVRYSVFTEHDLHSYYNAKPNGRLIKMTYNVALPKRLNMKSLVEDVGMRRSDYWGFREITKEQFQTILELSNVPMSAVLV
ncbi:MAG: hypothetical protein ACK5JO_10850 [Halodesulfovibrio sp.]